MQTQMIDADLWWAKCWNFEVLFFDNFRISSESVTFRQGCLYVGY